MRTHPIKPFPSN